MDDEEIADLRRRVEKVLFEPLAVLRLLDEREALIAERDAWKARAEQAEGKLNVPPT